MHSIRKIVSIAACCITIIVFTGCGTAKNDALENEWDASHADKVAANTSERIQFLLNWDREEDHMMDQSQIDMLERALTNNGEVSRSDYLTSWDNYRQCVVNKGYTSPPIHQIDGIYIHQTKSDMTGMSEEQQEKATQDNNDCQSKYNLAVDEIYTTNVANPGLYRDPDVALVDCLHRNNLVSREYTLQQYHEESQKFSDMDVSGARTQQEAYNKRRAAYSFDFNNPTVRTCVVANDSNLFIDQLDVWKPFS